MNPILDGYPEEFEGFLIRSDFRIGIQISQCLTDEELEDLEKIAVAVNLLFGLGAPEPDIAVKGLSWFLNGGMEPAKIQQSEDGEKFFDFDIDAGRILTAFHRFYQIDLTKETMHWFQFLAMLGDLGECAYTSVIGYRTTQITSDMSPGQRKLYSEMKKKYSLVEYTEDELDRIQDFLSELKENT